MSVPGKAFDLVKQGRRLAASPRSAAVLVGSVGLVPPALAKQPGGLSLISVSNPLWAFVAAALLVLSLVSLIALDRRSRRERQLRAELEALKRERDSTLANMPVGFYILVDSGDRPFQFERISDRALDLLGVTRPMVQEQAMAALTHLHPDDREWLLAHNEKARQAGARFVAEARFLVEGRQRWLRIESLPRTQGKVTRWFGYVIDVTDRHEAEAKFRILYEQSPVAISIHDPQTGEVLDANRAAWEIHALTSPEELKRFPLWEKGSHSPDQALVLLKAAAGGQRQRFEWQAVDGHGRLHWMLVSLMPIVMDGQLRVFSTVSDITETKAAQQRFEAIFKKAPIASFVQDAETGQVLVANEQAARTYGFDSPEAFLADPAVLVADGEYSWEHARARLSEAMAKGGDRFVWKSLHTSGREIWMDVALTPVHLDGRDCVLAACADITTRKEAELRLEESENRFRRILQDIDGVAVQGYRGDGSVSYWNRASEVLYGYTEEEAKASTLFDLIIPEPMREAVRANVALVGEGGDIPNGELELMRKDGTRVPVYSSHTVLRAPDAEPELFCIDIDLSERKAHEEALDRMANYDSLTGLPNRRLMADLIEQMMARVQRHERTLALCYLDLDDFKPINDKYGHDIGDEVLVTVAQRLRRLVRGSDLVARLGGDEFVVAMDGIGEGPELDSRLRFLLEVVAQPIQIDRLELQVYASLGVTLYPRDSNDPDVLLRHADQAMYRAKSQGRNQYRLFDIELEANAKRRREQLARIERGLDQHEFRLHYQPKVDLVTGTVRSFEGLVRWHVPGGEVRSPMSFLPDLDRSDLEIRFGEAMIEQALAQLCRWIKNDLEVSISVNVSGPHLLSDGFVQTLADLLARYPACSPNRLALEIVESAAVHDLKRAIQVLQQVRTLGVQVSLDDFGTGYSSLSHLRSLPVDEVKVDQSFVRDMLEDINDRKIVQSVIGLAGAFGLRVVAEGVETEAHVDALRELGCPLGQGYVFARPMPAEEVPAWLAGQSSSTSS